MSGGSDPRSEPPPVYRRTPTRIRVRPISDIVLARCSPETQPCTLLTGLHAPLARSGKTGFRRTWPAASSAPPIAGVLSVWWGHRSTDQGAGFPPEARAERGRRLHAVRGVSWGSDIDSIKEGQPVVAARVLVADDEESIRKLLALALSDAGYEVATASDGVEAFQKLQLTDVDLLVTDLKIGRMDGYELCRRVRQTSALPIVVISGGVMEDEEPGLGASMLDADALVRKPFDVMELVQLVRGLLPPDGKLAD